MPASSKAQQRLFGAVVAAQKGKKAGSSKIAKMAKDISKKDAKDFASTPTKNLPDRVKKEEAIKRLREYIRKKLVKEMNTTGNIEGFDTPYAFTKPGMEKKKGQKFAKLTGYSAVNENVHKISWSYGKENPEDGYFRFFADGGRGIDKKTLLRKYPQNQKLKQWMQDIEKDKRNLNGIGGDIKLTDTDVLLKENSTVNEGTFLSQNHIASFDDKKGSNADVFKKGNKYYAIVSGDVDYDMEASNAKEMADKLKRDGFKYPAYAGKLNESLISEVQTLISNIKKETLNENRWLELKREDSPVKAKIGKGISSINKQLSEVERFLNWYGRLKQESGITGGDFWKRTNRNIYKIKERLIKLEQHIRKFV